MTDGEIYRIEIEVPIVDKTEPALGQIQVKLSKFEERMQKTEERIQRMNKTRLQLLMSAIDKASGVIDYIGAKARTLIKKPWQMTVHVIDMATRPLRSIFNFATSIQGIITGIIAGAAAQKLVAGPMALADSLAQAEVGFETMLGSAEKAKKMMTDIKQFAIKTPFETNEIIDQTQRMMAMGWAAKDVLRDMERIGNAAAATGKGALGMDRIILALGQIRMKGKLSAEELNQLAEAGIRAREYIAKGLGVDIPTAMSMAEKGMIDANKAIDMILKGMDEFDGQMDKTANRTVKGLISQIKDAFSVSIFERWGKGLQRGAISGLVKFNDWISNNRSILDKWGESLEKIGETISTAIVNKLDSLSRRANDVFNSDAFKNATRLSDKIKIAWDKIVAEPFQEWWNGPGQKKITAMAESIGRALGGGIGGFIMSALGVASDPKKLAKESPFLSAGAAAGKAFLDAFLEAFDAQKVAQKAVDAFKSVSKDAGKVMPGGERPSSTSWMSAALLGWLFGKVGGFKLVGGGLKLLGKGAIKGAGSLFKHIFKNHKAVENTVKTVADVAPVTAKTAEVAGNIFIANKAGQVTKTIEVLKNADEAAKVAEVAGTISKSTKGVGLLGKLGSVSKYLNKVGKGIKGIPIVGTALGLLGSGVTVATASPENRGREAAGEAGSWIGSLGAGAAAGALVGTLGGGPIGTAIGAAVGGIGGAIGGEAFTEWLYDKFGFGKSKGTASENELVGATKQRADAEILAKTRTEELTAQQQYLASSVGNLVGVNNILTSDISNLADRNSLLAAQTYDLAKTQEFLESGTGTLIDSQGDLAIALENLSYAADIATNKLIRIPSAETAPKPREEKQGFFSWIFGKHAAGGIMTTPHVGLVAEAGPEAIIPLSPSRRSRGLTLWQKVGEILGARPYAEGGILGQINSAIAGRISKDETESDKTFTPRPAGLHAAKTTPDISIKVQSSPVFRIETAEDGKSVIEVIRSNIQTIADELSDEVAEKLTRIFQNMPEVEGV